MPNSPACISVNVAISVYFHSLFPHPLSPRSGSSGPLFTAHSDSRALVIRRVEYWTGARLVFAPVGEKREKIGNLASGPTFCPEQINNMVRFYGALPVQHGLAECSFAPGRWKRCMMGGLFSRKHSSSCSNMVTQIRTQRKHMFRMESSNSGMEMGIEHMAK